MFKEPVWSSRGIAESRLPGDVVGIESGGILRIRRVLVPFVIVSALLAGQIQAFDGAAFATASLESDGINGYVATDQTAVEIDGDSAQPNPETDERSPMSAALADGEWTPNFGLWQFMESTAVSPSDGALGVGTTPLLVQTATGNLYEEPTQYKFIVCTKYSPTFSSDSCLLNDTVAMSGWQTSPKWQVPAGTLQLNLTYTWTAFSRAGGATTSGYGSQDSNWFATGASAQGTPPYGRAAVKQVSPATATYIPTLTPTLSARTKIQEVGITVYVRFSVFACGEPMCASRTEVANSGWRSDRTWTVPAPALRWGGLYAWTVQVGSVEPMTGSLTAQPGDLNPRTFATAIPVSNAAHLGLDAQSPRIADVNLFDRHYEYTATDAAVITAGTPLSLTRQYSSSNARSGTAFGPGWSSILDTSLVAASAFVGYYVRLPDGHEVAFGRNPDNSYAPAPGSEGMTLSPCNSTCSGGDLVFTDQVGAKYVFASNRLVKIIDADLREQALVYDATGKIVKVVDTTTSRALGFAWSQGRVLQVTVEPALPGVPATWNYSYRGNRLVAVCGPETRIGCMTYNYRTSAPNTLLAVVAPNGIPTQEVTYDSTGRTVKSVSTDGYLSAFTRTTAPNSGQTIKISEASGLSSTYILDSFGRNTDYTTSAGAHEKWVYNNQGQLIFYDNLVTKGAIYLSYKDGRLFSREVRRDSEHVYTQNFAYITGDGPAKGKLRMISDGEQDQWWYTAPNSSEALYEFEYNAQGRLSAEHFGKPGVNRSTTRYAYTTGAESVCGGTAHPPSGLLKSRTDPLGKISARTYTSQGQLCVEASPVGGRLSYTYDQLGRLLSKSESIVSSEPTLVEAYRYGRNGLLQQITTPSIVDAVTGQDRQLVTTMAYDNDYNLTSRTQTDLHSAESLTTSYTYDQYDQLVSTTEPDGAVTTNQYDSRGHLVNTTSPNGTTAAFEYDLRGDLTKTIAIAYDSAVDSVGPRNIDLEVRTYDGAGRLATLADRAGFVRQFDYYSDDRLRKVTAVAQPTADGGNEDVVLQEFAYDRYGNATRIAQYNERTVTSVIYDAKSQMTSSTTVIPAVGQASASTRTSVRTYDLRGAVLSESVGASADEPFSTTQYKYDDAGRMIRKSVGTSSTSTDQAVSYYKLNLRGEVIGSTDALASDSSDVAHTTEFQYDVLGNLTAEIRPPAGSGAPRPTVKFGYDAFGRQTEVIGADGARVARTFDTGGRLLSETSPYLAASALGVPSTQYAYTPIGQVSAVMDKAGIAETTQYDTLGQPTSVTRSPRVEGGAPRTWVTHYNDAGNPVQLIEPTGAVTDRSFNSLGQLVSTTSNSTGPSGPQAATTTYTYDLAGNTLTETKPEGGVSTYEYDAANELVSQSDPDGGVTHYGYGYLGQVTRLTDPLGSVRVWEYDPRGNRIAENLKNSSGDIVRASNWAFDKADNAVSRTNPRGGVRTIDYNAHSRPVEIEYENGTSASFGYDAIGNLTTYTDPRGNITTATYNAEGAIASLLEPSTPAFPAESDRLATWQYDSAGRLAVVANPGGSTVSNTYDGDGNVTSQTAVDGTRTDVRTFSYDDVDRLIAFSHPNGTQTVTYNELGWETGSTGPAGNSTLQYNLDGNVTERTDSSGTSTATWTAAGRLATLQSGTDPALTFTRNASGQVTREAWGALATRDFTYDTAGSTLSDTTKSTTGEILASTDYTYDPAGNIVSKDIGPENMAGSGTTSYTYDTAERLTAWTTGDATNHTNVWDAANNATTFDGVQRSFDSRNRLSSSDGMSYEYNARGDLESSGGSVARALSYDAFGQLVDDGSNVYSYDALSRLARAGADSFTYPGTEPDPVSVGNTLFSRAPDGAITSIAGSLAISNSHGDVTARVGQDLSVTSTDYSPFGGQIAATGSSRAVLGYQADFTSTSGLVNMHARWFDPSLGTFVTRDSIPFGTVQQNRYAYGGGNPVNRIDPSGLTAIPIGGPGIMLPSLAGLGASLSGYLGSLAIPGLGQALLAGLAIVGGATLFAFGIQALVDSMPYAHVTHASGTPSFSAPRSDPYSSSAAGTSVRAPSRAPGYTRVDVGAILAQARADAEAAWAQSVAEMIAMRNRPIVPTEQVIENVRPALSKVSAGSALCGAALSGGACTATASSVGAGCAGLGAQIAKACLPSAVDIWQATDVAPPSTTADDERQGVTPTTQAGGAGSGGRPPRTPSLSSDDCHDATPGGDNLPRRVKPNSKTRQEVIDRTAVDENGSFLGPDQQPITGSWDLGHVRGEEWWRTAQIARDLGWTGAEIKEHQNNPDIYQIEDRSVNRSHVNEMKPC